jgi:hypothetical protein
VNRYKSVFKTPQKKTMKPPSSSSAPLKNR